MTSTFTETFHNGGFLVSEALGTRSRDQGVLISGQNLAPGTVLGQITALTTAPVAAAFAGNTGNGAMGAITESAGAMPGVYKLTIVAAATNAGHFIVETPNGVEIGTGNVAAAFSAGGLAFTLADGSTDFVVGDGFNITVGAGSLKWTQLATGAADGSQNAAGILWGAVDASGGDMACTVVVRAAEVNASELTWPSGITSPQKTAALAQLAAPGIQAR